MARVVVIGGSGHVGTYLVPRLVEAGHDVVNVSRGERAPYQGHAAWDKIEAVRLDRNAEESAGTFGDKIRDLKPDVVIDMICFTPESARQLNAALAGQVSHLIHVGTIWVHGFSLTVPTRESDPRRPFGEYGTRKSEIENALLGESRRGGVPATVVRPGHIVGPGWIPLNPAGHFNPEIFSVIAAGHEMTLPNFGLETVHHVHADDIAQMIMRAMDNWSVSVGEAFNAVSPAAITLRGYAEAMYAWFGFEPRLKFQPFDEWKHTVPDEDAAATWEHIARSPCHSIEKARRLLGYEPRYTSLMAVQESVRWLLDQGRI